MWMKLESFGGKRLGEITLGNKSYKQSRKESGLLIARSLYSLSKFSTKLNWKIIRNLSNNIKNKFKYTDELDKIWPSAGENVLKNEKFIQLSFV